MPKRLSRVSVENAVNQLVEALYDRDAARVELERFKAAHPAPEPPPEFDHLHAFLDYHDRRREYEDEVAKREKTLSIAEKSYARAADSLRDVLPENVLLHYDYMGRRTSLNGKKYGILNRQGEIIVPSIETAPS